VNATQRRLWVHEASAAHLVDGPALAEHLGMPRGTFRRWAAQTGLPRRGTDDRGRALYDVGEALRHAERHGRGCAAGLTS
jgi:hypothetical protein